MTATEKRAVGMDSGNGKNNAEGDKGQLQHCWCFLRPSTLLEYHMAPEGFVSWVENCDCMYFASEENLYPSGCGFLDFFSLLVILH